MKHWKEEERKIGSSSHFQLKEQTAFLVEKQNYLFSCKEPWKRSQKPPSPPYVVCDISNTPSQSSFNHMTTQILILRQLSDLYVVL